MQNNKQQFEFHGKTDEFFKIWIVNVMLSVVTLGIYSAWAKVRTRQYFYSNTILMNRSFDYLADPVKILKGRVFAFIIIMLYSFSTLVSPLFQGLLMVAFIPLLPWIIIKALKFTLYNTAYSNLRFHFKADYLNALWVFIGIPILVAFSAGLAYPYFVRERKRLVINSSHYGTSPFKLSATTGQFYSIYIKAIATTILLMILIATFSYLFQTIIPTKNNNIRWPILPPLISFLFFPLILLLFTYLYTAVTNLVFNHSTINDYQFESHLQTTKMCWLYFSNTLAIIFSFGLLIPWTMIRTAKYRLSCLVLLTDEDPDTFITAAAENADAIAEELGDLLDIDIGL